LLTVRSGGAEHFIPGSGSPNGTDYYKAFEAKGYQVVHSNEQLKAAKSDKKTLGIFSSKSFSEKFSICSYSCTAPVESNM